MPTRRSTLALPAATTQSLRCEQGCCCAQTFLPKASSGKPGELAHPAKRAAARRLRIRLGAAGVFYTSFCFKKPEMDTLSRDCFNDVVLAFSASLLVGLWYVKLNYCRASGPNLNIALGCSTVACLGQAGTNLAYSAAYHTHSIPLDRMGLRW